MSDESNFGLEDILGTSDNKKPNGSVQNASGGDKDVEDWLSGSADETMVSPEGAASFLRDSVNLAGEGDDEADLSWFDDVDSSSSSTTNAVVASGGDTVVLGADVDMEASSFFDTEDVIGNVLDDLLPDEVAGNDINPNSSDFVVSQSTAKRIRENKVDRIIMSLLRELSRPKMKAIKTEKIFKDSVGKIVDTVKAELVAVVMKEGDKLDIPQIYFSENLPKRLGQTRDDFFAELKRKLEATKLQMDDQSVVGRCLRDKKVIFSHNVQAAGAFAEVNFDVRRTLCAPIVDGDKVFGAIQVINKDESSGEDFFSNADSMLVEDVARYLGRLLHRIEDAEVVPDEQELAGYFARMSKCDEVDLAGDEIEIDVDLIKKVGEANIRKYAVLPLSELGTGQAIRAAMINPLEYPKRNGFEAVTGYSVEEVMVTTPSALDGKISDIFGTQKKSASQEEIEGLLTSFDGSKGEEIEIVDDSEDSGPIIQLANKIIEGAYRQGASDIHIEPFEEQTRVRYRVDGELREVYTLPINTNKNLISRIKIMSALDISERRIPQDGKIKYKRWNNKKLDFDLRVATGPMAFGEKACLRLLVKGNISLGLSAMGFSPENMELYRWAVEQPYGMILNVGPTGSGKTTTLYSALSECNSPTINIHTAEDPIEYPLHGINQMQMQKDIGLTFASALKCFLRMDPDVILVGEIRDLETGEIGIEAALTGHLLFSTLHTNDAAGTVVRFIEMGIEPFMISSSLLLVCAQRLGRRLCKQCRIAYEPSEEELKILNKDPRPINSMFKKNIEGCNKCNRGYKGRVGIHEILTLNEELRDAINRSASADELKAAAMRNNMMTMFQDALWKVKDGVTDLEEVVASIKQDGDVER